jgi:hypothetical protein
MRFEHSFFWLYNRYKLERQQANQLVDEPLEPRYLLAGRGHAIEHRDVHGVFHEVARVTRVRVLPTSRREVLATEHEGRDRLIRAEAAVDGRCCQPALLPGGALRHVVQVQLADDSLHAVRIALRQKIFEIVKRFDRAKLPCRRDVHDDRLVIA